MQTIHAVHGSQGFRISKTNHVMHGIDFLKIMLYNEHVLYTAGMNTMPVTSQKGEIYEPKRIHPGRGFNCNWDYYIWKSCNIR